VRGRSGPIVGKVVVEAGETAAQFALSARSRDVRSVAIAGADGIAPFQGLFRCGAGRAGRTGPKLVVRNHTNAE
jgi:hypothetical protein